MIPKVLLILGSIMCIAEYYNQKPIHDVDYPVEYSDESLMSVDSEEGESNYKQVSDIKTDVIDPVESQAAVKSLRIGRFKVNPENIGDLLHREMADMSPDLHNKLADTLTHNGVDHKKYRDLFLIKKRVIDDGKRRIINFNIKERIIPKEIQDDSGISRDFGTRALLGGIMFLLAGLVFTTTLKMYQSIIRKSYFNLDDKGMMIETKPS